ncbi:phytoene/squalene synthase family protein [Limnohabitans sp. DM1]|uniref:phytoene/squalene synthase family protein n=1 Tax=Limnohabitans sp. DM1 TaxID=1597955 RepID=UPI000A9C54A8|nr:phytoene/squalene synthase family protein [Limnohabitans sp. DM1]
MPASTLLTRKQLPLLRGVSRSFYLTIRLLPPALQGPIAVGYLLARATDTVADTTAQPAAERLALLSGLAQAIQSPAGSLQAIQSLLSEFARHQTDPHERALMQALPDCLPLLHDLAPDDQASVRWVLGHITRGQVLDVQRFGQGPAALATEFELDDYTWLVAGCVGEFWTELCERHLPGFATQSADAMRLAGRAYGMGLQRLNILRDAGADLAAGRCYLPEARLAPLGLSPEQLRQAARTGDAATLQLLVPLWGEYLQQTHTQLSEGLHYSQCLSSRRLRLACALPALIGARTVALLRQAGPQALTQRVKMPRHEMRALLWRLIWRLASPHALDREFQSLSQ